MQVHKHNRRGCIESIRHCPVVYGRSVVIETFLAAQAELGEGPSWDATFDRLVWVDIVRGEVHGTTADGQDSLLWQTSGPTGFVAQQSPRAWYVAHRDRIALVENWTTEREVASLGLPERVRINDGKLGPDGRLFFGTMNIEGSGTDGEFYRMESSGEIETLVDGIGISNGLCWKADSTQLFYIDTPTGRIDTFDFDAEHGAISNRSTVVQFEPEWGSPDGMTILDDLLWVACWGGWAVRAFSLDGQLAEVVQVPAMNPTSCTFGGDGRLYVTSALVDSSRTADDGSIFVVSL